MVASIDGLITGLDTTKLIDGLLSVQTRRIALLQSKEDKAVKQQSAFKNVEARLLALQSAIGRLGRAQNGAFDGKLVASSNEDLLTAAASSSASPGVYALRVNSLARSEQVASQGFDSLGSAITQGTFQIGVGTQSTATITIDGTNNTLSGLAQAINNAAVGVTATIINDGSDSRTQPYRLVLSSDKTGAENSITISNGLAADNGSARRPEFSATSIGPAVTSAAYTGTSVPTANAGAGTYTGTANKTYTFTVATGGTVGVTDGIVINYADSTGTQTGTITLNAADQDAFKTVAEGLQVKLGAGTLVAGETFSVDAFVPMLQKASNASVTIGSGSGALNVESATNRVEGLINGVSLSLQAADSTKEVRLTVDNDTKTASQAVGDFVEAFNGLMDFIDTQVKYDAQSGTAGTLLGNRSVTVIQDEVRRTVGGLVEGVKGQMNRLGALGITFDSKGHLELNQARLDDALAGRIAGVSFADVRRLFALAGESTNSGIQFVVGGTRTKATGAAPYQVEISQAAQRAAITATNSLAASTIIDSSNNTLTLTIDGKSSGTITLANGTYTRLALARHLEAQINADADLAGRRVAVSFDSAGDRLLVTSQTYGQASEVKIGSGTALAALGFTGVESDQGQDVVGKFIVNGVDEPAVGTGQFLVGSSTNANTADLQVRVSLDASQLVAGPEADLTVTRGVASKLDVVLSGMLDPVNGRLKTIDNGFQATVDDIEDSIKQQNALTELRRQSLIRQFAALETTVNTLKSTGDFLTAQLTTFSPQKSK